MNPDHPSALIADDEPPLRAYLKALLADAWPELVICAEAGNGPQALAAVETHRPQVAFLDIRMPGLSGLQVAETIAASCRIVFVTAYDEYAVSAFEKAAADYLLKPVTPERLLRTVTRLRTQLADAHGPTLPSARRLAELMERIAAATPPAHLQWLRVPYGDGIRMLPVDEVVFFQARDKYTAVITPAGEALIGTSIRDLTTALDPQRFWQINRGTIVHIAWIDKVSRSLTGRGVIRLKSRPETLTISRSYLHRFKQM